MTSTVTMYVGDVRDVMAGLPDNFFAPLITSPPFLALRSYLPADHPDKHREIGSEPTPAAFLDTLLGLTADWGRLVPDWGSICVELGDTMSGSGGEGTRTNNLYNTANRYSDEWNKGNTAGKAMVDVPTLGFTDCGHDAWRRGHVLDPFGGSGTTAVAAALEGRDATLIDLDRRNVDLVHRRLTETVRIIDRTDDGDTITWTVEPASIQQLAAIARGQGDLFGEHFDPEEEAEP